MADKNKSGDFYNRPEKLGAWEGFSQFLWNGETKQFMGRTSSSWAKILLFYLIFYAVLTAFFLSLWFIFATSLTEEKPKYQLSESCIGKTPGLGFRPMPPESNVESTLIWYQKNNKNNSAYWSEEIDRFLEPFKQQNRSNTIDCIRDTARDGESCKVDMNSFGNCASNKGYGYEEGKPCIFLKLNKIFNWAGDYYRGGIAETNLPREMPKQLKDTIMKDTSNLDVIWVSCEGERPGDVENLGKDVKYYSMGKVQGFLGRFFPFKKSDGYLQPLVAVQFSSIKPGVLVNIECKAWTKDIKHEDFDRKDRKGSVHFEILIDEPKK